MITFGDFEPEDAWSPGDEPEELVKNLIDRIVLLGVHFHVRGTIRHKLDEIDHKLRHWYKTRAAEASERELVRAADIERHIVVIRDRLADG